MNKEELQNELQSKKEELKTISYEMGKAFNAADKNNQILHECKSSLDLFRYAVMILSLVSVTILVSLINTFSIPFLILDIVLITGDIFSIIKFKKLNKHYKDLTTKQSALNSNAEELYKQVLSMKTTISEIENQLKPRKNEEKKPKKTEKKESKQTISANNYDTNIDINN